MKDKIWIRLFVRISAIFAAFVLVLMLANSTLLYQYFEYSARWALGNTGKSLAKLDLSTSTVDEVADALSTVEGQNLLIDIYAPDGRVIYTAFGDLLWDVRNQPEELKPGRPSNYRITGEEYSDGNRFITAVDDLDGSEYLLYRTDLDGGYRAEMRVQKLVMESSANVANQFVTVIAVLILCVSIPWIIYFAMKFSKPITEMNSIARKMADLNFEEKLIPTSRDEIGQLAVSINELSEKLDGTLRDLRCSNAKLRDEIEIERRIDRMRKDFVANVSHELKTPISIIQGYAEGLKLGVCDRPEDYCDIILEESVRMNRLVVDLLDLSRYESGQITIERRRFDIVALLRDMCRRLEKRVHEAGATLCMNRTEPIFVLGDIVHIEQIVNNYLSNAISHVCAGGEIRVELEQQEQLAVIRVSNTGKPIPEEEMPMLWQSFYRSDKSHKRDSARFGLGLSIVKSLVELHGRACGVYNTQDGVCFWFDMDLSQEDEPIEEISAQASTARPCDKG